MNQVRKSGNTERRTRGRGQQARRSCPPQFPAWKMVAANELAASLHRLTHHCHRFVHHGRPVSLVVLASLATFACSSRDQEETSLSDTEPASMAASPIFSASAATPIPTGRSSIFRTGLACRTPHRRSTNRIVPHCANGRTRLVAPTRASATVWSSVGGSASSSLTRIVTLEWGTWRSASWSYARLSAMGQTRLPPSSEPKRAHLSRLAFCRRTAPL